jgi:hypothetical protein
MSISINSMRVVALVALATAHAASFADDRLVAPLSDQNAIDGCSWSASAPSTGDGYVFLAEIGDEPTLMHIDGHDLRLELVNQSGRLKKVGDALERTYRSGDVQVRARFKATWVCPVGDESCEVTKYLVTFQVSKGARSQTIEATGDVGC